jgi:hypothetical protein
VIWLIFGVLNPIFSRFKQGQGTGWGGNREKNKTGVNCLDPQGMFDWGRCYAIAIAVQAVLAMVLHRNKVRRRDLMGHRDRDKPEGDKRADAQ